MDYFIGIDGGGTKTKAVLVDNNLNIIAETIGEPSNFLVFGIEKVTSAIIDLLNTICKKGNIKLEEVKSILIGTAGAGRDNDVNNLTASILNSAEKSGITINNFFVESDARIALEGAFAGGSGSILIAGTGSIMFGKNNDGVIYRVGGFGRQLGDEGSGFHIGSSGLNAVAKDYDKRGMTTILTTLLKEKFNIASSEELIKAVYSNNFDIPQVTPLVIKAAEKGDEICKEILDRESDELITHIIAMKEKMNCNILRVSLIGGTITTDNYYAKIFKNKISNLKDVRLESPNLSPETGAALMAINKTKKI